MAGVLNFCVMLLIMDTEICTIRHLICTIIKLTLLLMQVEHILM